MDDPDYRPGAGRKRKATKQVTRRNKCRVCGMFKAGHICPGFWIEDEEEDEGDNKNHICITTAASLVEKLD